MIGPVVIDTTVGFIGFQLTAPFQFGGYTYVLVDSVTVDFSSSVNNMFKSSDGLSWTNVGTGASTSNGNFYDWFVRGDTFYLCYQSGNGNPIQIQTFTMGPDTFGTPSTLTGAPTSSQQANMVVLATGDVIVAYVSATQCLLGVYSSGVWTIDILVGEPDPSPSFVLTGNLVLDPSDRVHIMFQVVPSGFVLTSLVYYANYLSGTVNDLTAVYTGLENGRVLAIGRGAYVLGRDAVEWPIQDFNSPVNVVIVIGGTPSSGPVFSNTTVRTTPIIVYGEQPDTLSIVVNSTGTIVTVFWEETLESGQVNLMSSTNRGSSWTPASVFYAVPGLIPLDLLGIRVTQFSDAPSFGFVVSGTIVLDSVFYCGIAYFFESSGAQKKTPPQFYKRGTAHGA